MKTGTYVRIDGTLYMFLGWSDYKQKWAVFADTHGNKHTRYFPKNKLKEDK